MNWLAVLPIDTLIEKSKPFPFTPAFMPNIMIVSKDLEEIGKVNRSNVNEEKKRMILTCSVIINL